MTKKAFDSSTLYKKTILRGNRPFKQQTNIFLKGQFWDPVALFGSILLVRLLAVEWK